jgi:hypothetical protein
MIDLQIKYSINHLHIIKLFVNKNYYDWYPFKCLLIIGCFQFVSTNHLKSKNFVSFKVVTAHQILNIGYSIFLSAIILLIIINTLNTHYIKRFI